MARELYVPRKFKRGALELIERANTIISEYQGQGFTLTLRQLYYQFVARGILPNSVKSYSKLGAILNKARLAGLVDWEAIEDRTRNLRQLPRWDSPRDLLEACAEQFRYDKWADQPARVECWIEKDALVGVIERVCQENQVSFFACRGYTSQSEQWRAGKRFLGYVEGGQRVVLLHLGDHDPSGIDMTRDNGDRLRMFIAGRAYADYGRAFEVRRLALNMDQVEKYNPPPNPAKLTDSRVGGYIKKYGSKSWELDALDPPVIAALIQGAIDDVRDPLLWASAQAREAAARGRLRKLAAGWAEKSTSRGRKKQEGRR